MKKIKLKTINLRIENFEYDSVFHDVTLIATHFFFIWYSRDVLNRFNFEKSRIISEIIEETYEEN